MSNSPHREVIQNEFELGEFEQLKVVGKGGSSTVFKGILKKGDRVVAIKQIDTEGISSDQVLNIKGEIDTIRTLAHEHIVCYLGTLKMSKPSKILIFLEYADRGSLRQFYQRKGALSEPQAANCTRQLIAGLEYLHANSIAHRDVKCANCLLTKEGVVKLADFGASKRFETDSVISGLKGTPHWMAPEVIKGTQMTSGWLKADVWSVGCTVVEMVTGKLPFSEYENPMTAMYHIANGQQPPLPEDISDRVSDALKDFIAACCAVNPDERPDASAMKTKPFPARHKAKKKGGRSPLNGGVAGHGDSAGRLVTKGSAGNILATAAKQPTLTSTPSEALTEPYHNPLTRENSHVSNVAAAAAAEKTGGLVQQMPPQSTGSSNSGSNGNGAGVGNGVGIISTDGTTTNEGSHSGSHTAIGTDVNAHYGGSSSSGATLTSDTAAISNTEAAVAGGVSEEDGSGSGSEEEDELYLDDFEEGGDTAEGDTDARVEYHAPAGTTGFADDGNGAPGGGTGTVQEGEFSFADLIAQDEARKAAEEQEQEQEQEQGQEQGGGRVEYKPGGSGIDSGAGGGAGQRQRPDNRPSRTRPGGARASTRPTGVSVEGTDAAEGEGAGNPYGQAPSSATLRAGHSRPPYFDVPTGDKGDGDGDGGAGAMGSEWDAQLARTRDIRSQVGLGPTDGRGTADAIMRSSLGSVGSLDTVNVQTEQPAAILRPSPSSEVYLEQQPAASARPQAPLAGDLRRVTGSYEEQQHGGAHLRSSISSVRSSVSTPGSAGSNGSGVHAGIDSDLLSRASSSGSASVRREALEALEQGDSAGPAGQPAGLSPFDYQHQDSRPRNGGGSRYSNSRRGSSKKQGGASIRSQSANAAAALGTSGVLGGAAAGAASMRLPPMGGSALAPLVVPEQGDMGEGIGIAGQASSLGILARPSLAAAKTTGGVGPGLGVINHTGVPVNFSSRPIYSAPSAVSRGLTALGEDSPGGGALPPLQSLTPKIKKKGSLGRLGGASELHMSK